jgi:capsular exopolysaccharide synthesis family protein
MEDARGDGARAARASRRPADDEPTNHLDIESIIWLEAFLKSLPGALLMTSHDREFMNRTVTRIAEIDGGEITAYSGNYDFYERERSIRDANKEAAYARQQAMFAKEQRFIERFAAHAAKAAQVQSRVKALDKIEKVEPPRKRRVVEFDFRQPPRSGDQVVVIDGDLRRPQLNEIFGLTNSWGLTTLVNENVDIRTLPLQALVQRTKIDDLSVITAGPGTSSISRVLHAPSMKTLFDRLTAEFDYVLVDTPPAVEFSDARVLGRYVDGAILVIRAGVTTREAAMLVRDRLVEDNLIVIGTIINRWDAKAAYTSSYYSTLYQDGRA